MDKALSHTVGNKTYRSTGSPSVRFTGGGYSLVYPAERVYPPQPERMEAEVRGLLAEKCLRLMLDHNKGALHPSRGKTDAQLIRKVCEAMGWDEDQYMDRMYKRDPEKWGLE